jgi:nucleoid-associated protein YgaU
MAGNRTSASAEAFDSSAVSPNAAAPPTKVTKAVIKTELGASIPCMFNPESLELSRSNQWAPGEMLPGKHVPLLTFTGSAGGSLSLKLFFDTTDTGEDVTLHTAKLAKLMDLEQGLPGTDEATHNARPQWVRFCWGHITSFKAVITSFSLTLTYFSSTGMPLRADVSLSLTQYEDDNTTLLQNPTSFTPFPHRVHRVMPGETLDRISAAHYGDSTQWRRIATANAIEDPLAVRPGTLLAIPEGV